MIKFVALFVFLAALWLTWNLTYTENPVQFETHASLQLQVENIISSFISKHRPNATNVQFHKVWTETLNPQKIKVSFDYSFVDPVDNAESTEQRFQGFAVLNKSSEGDGQQERWSLDEVMADTQTIIFKNGTQVPYDKQGTPTNQTAPAHGETGK